MMMKNEITEFMNKWNSHRAEFGLHNVEQVRGYKFTRMIDIVTGKTEMFVKNSNGGIYKAATNIARAQTQRGMICQNNLFQVGGLLSDGTVKHLNRGRKPTSTVGMVGSRDALGGIIIHPSTHQLKNA